MADAKFALVQQMQQWFTRLVEQLNDMEDCRCEIDGDDLELMKEVTIQQIKKFSQALERVLQGDAAEEPELSKLKVSLRNLVSSSFDTEELVKYFGPQGATDVGLELLQLEEDFKLKKVDSIVYFEQKRRTLEELQCRGFRLSEKEEAFLAQVD